MNPKSDKKDSTIEVKGGRISRIYLEYQSSLKRFVGRFIQQPQDVEDIVQDAFIRTFTAEVNTKIHSPKAFLFKTAKNLAFNHLDKCSYKLVDHIEDINVSEFLVDDISTETRAQSDECFTVFFQAVDKLPIQCRKAFVLRKLYGFTHSEISQKMGISRSTVEKHLATGLLKCHQHMRNQGYNFDGDGFKKQGWGPVSSQGNK